MSKTKKEYNVTILSRDDVTTFPKLGQSLVTRLITYVAAGLPPHTVRIAKDEWTPELEKIQIRASIEARLKKKPEAYRV